jgi:hypothetical protein
MEKFRLNILVMEKLYTIFSIKESSNKTDLVNVMEGHIIENALLVGLYGRE